MAPPNVKTNAPEDGRDETRVDRMLKTAVTLAQQLTQGVGILARTAALAGGALWLIAWWPPSVRSGTLLGAGLTLLLLLAPAAVLGLFYAGLRDLAALPDRLSNRVSKTTEASVESYRAATDTSNSWWGWGRRLLGQIWALRSLFAEHRTFLVRYGAMLRLLTPGFLLLVVGAAGATFLLVPVTGLVLFFTAFL
jgi:hypothetical protein